MNPMLVVVVVAARSVTRNTGRVGGFESHEVSPAKNTRCVDEGFRPTAYVNVARGNFTLQLSEGGNWIRL